MLFSIKGYDIVSLKEISAEAEVTPAMISYYFDDKAGLLKAVMKLASSLMLDLSKDILAESEKTDFAKAFSSYYLPFMTEHAWIIPLLTREVLSKDSEARHFFMKDHSSVVHAMLSPKIRNEIENKDLRPELDPDFTQLCLIGMGLFPFIAAPVLSPLFGYKLDEDFAENYGAHIYSIFMNGAANKNG